MAKYTLNATIFLSLTDDIIFTLLVIMPLQEFLSQNIVSKTQNQIIKRVMDNNPHFWQEKANKFLSEELFSITQDYKNVLLERHFLKNFIKNQIDRGLNAYIRKKKELLFFSMSDETYEFKNERKSITFSLNTVIPYLMEDNPEKLFAIFTPFNYLAASFHCDNHSKVEMTDIVRKNLDKLNIFTNNEIRLIDLYFIGFIPFIMKARAIQCFEFFIRAYLTLAVGTHHNLLERQNLLMTPANLFALVFSSNDPYFKKELISLGFKIIPGDDAILFELLQFYYKQNAFDFVKQSLSGLSSEKAKDMQTYLNDHPLENLKTELFPNLKQEHLVI